MTNVIWRLGDLEMKIIILPSRLLLQSVMFGGCQSSPRFSILFKHQNTVHNSNCGLELLFVYIEKGGDKNVSSIFCNQIL